MFSLAMWYESMVKNSLKKKKKDQDWKKIYFGQRHICVYTSLRYVDSFISIYNFVWIMPNMYYGPHQSSARNTGNFSIRPPLCVLVNVNVNN